RTIWDGNQIVAELRSYAGAETEYTPGSFLGTVRYTHAGGIDEPLAVWKLDIGGIAPHSSWHGTYEAGTPVDASSSNVSWPGRGRDAFYASDARMSVIEPT